MDEVGGHLVGPGSTNGKSLSPQEKVLIFLFYLAGNSLLRIKKYAHDIGMGTIVNAIRKCIDVFYEVLVPTYIRLPTPEQAKMESELFHDSSGFPKIIWAAIGNVNILKSNSMLNIFKNYLGSNLAAVLSI